MILRKMMLTMSISLAVLGSGFSFAAENSQFVENVHYRPLSSPYEVKKSEARLFFSFTCPHCHDSEPLFLASAPLWSVPLVKSHVPFMKRMSPDGQFNIARGAVVAEKLGQVNSYSNVVYAAIFAENPDLTWSEQDVKSVLSLLDGGEKASVMFDEPKVADIVNADEALAKKLLDEKQIRGVPSLVINGKFLINMGSLSVEKRSEELADLVNFLAEIDGKTEKDTVK